jgi:hypothetical protein
MDIMHGATVIDQDGKTIGNVDYIIRDAYTGLLKSFRVRTELVDPAPFFKVGDVLETTDEIVKLKIAFNQEVQ